MKQDSKAGFSIIEVAFVTMIIGVLSFLAMPSISKATQIAEATAMANNVRVLKDTIEFYGVSTGNYPATMNYTTVPPDVGEYLPNTFRNGDYEWYYFNMSGFHALYFINLGFTAEQGFKVDSTLDDSNIASGNIRILNGGDWIVYIFDRTS